jgi:hypothetical protein
VRTLAAVMAYRPSALLHRNPGVANVLQKLCRIFRYSVLNRVRTPGLVACSAAEGELGTYAVEIVPRALAIEVSGAVGLDVGDVAERLELANGGEHVYGNKTKSEIELFFPQERTGGVFMYQPGV